LLLIRYKQVFKRKSSTKMSLQPGINPLEASSMEEDRKRLERTMAARNFREGMIDRAKQADFNQHMQNTGGFDPSSLMAAPQLRQDATMNQANMVSSPYFEANEKAAEKTNPMNAASQEPGKSFLMRFIGKPTGALLDKISGR
jgi:hypothetical protein